MNVRVRLTWVVIFAAAMAWVESAVVFYLRTMLDRIEPYQAKPLPIVGAIDSTELVREAATMVMLLAVGWLAGTSWRTRLGFSAVAFGVWDILYYAFLKVICDWPHSLWEWDVLFLLPLPWWGPVAAPMLIALLMIAWGVLATQWEAIRFPLRQSVGVWTVNACGVVLALYVFMADALKAAGRGPEALREVLPQQFGWGLFCLALILMSAPVIQLAGGVVASRRTAEKLVRTTRAERSWDRALRPD